MSGIVRDLSNPIVIDNGSGMFRFFALIRKSMSIDHFMLTATMRAGFAGGVAPQVVFPTLTGRHHQLSTPSGKENVKTVFIGEEVLENSNMLRLRCPIEFGMITSWDDMELIWRHILHDQLHATLNDHPILLTEPILSPRSGREKATMMFFEEFNVPGRADLIC